MLESAVQVVRHSVSFAEVTPFPLELARLPSAPLKLFPPSRRLLPLASFVATPLYKETYVLSVSL